MMHHAYHHVASALGYELSVLGIFRSILLARAPLVQLGRSHR